MIRLCGVLRDTTLRWTSAVQGALAVSGVVLTMAVPEVRKRMAGVGIDAYVTTPEELMSLLLGDIDKFAKVVRFANIKEE